MHLHVNSIITNFLHPVFFSNKSDQKINEKIISNNRKTHSCYKLLNISATNPNYPYTRIS